MCRPPWTRAFLTEYLKATRVAVVFNNTEYGQGLAASLIQELEARGAQAVTNIEVEEGQGQLRDRGPADSGRQPRRHLLRRIRDRSAVPALRTGQGRRHRPDVGQRRRLPGRHHRRFGRYGGGDVRQRLRPQPALRGRCAVVRSLSGGGISQSRYLLRQRLRGDAGVGRGRAQGRTSSMRPRSPTRCAPTACPRSSTACVIRRTATSPIRRFGSTRSSTASSNKWIGNKLSHTRKRGLKQAPFFDVNDFEPLPSGSSEP